MSANKFLYGNGKERLLGTSSSIDLNDAETIATSKAVYELNKKIESTGRLPLGHFFLHPFPTPPDGCLVVNGSEYNRGLYKDLWVDVQIKGQYKTEAEWQQIASENGGYCPWYSDGNGSTTFRTPKFAPYQKLALISGDAGKYYSAGLPNIDGEIRSYVYRDGGPTGAFTSIVETYNIIMGGNAPDYNYTRYGFNASGSSSIYGNSATVQPESHDWIVCVVAFGTATNVGSVDVANVMSAVSQVQANPNLQGTAHLVETWKSTDGASWYRKYSDGWVEQGGPMSTNEKVTFHVSFSNTNYYIDVTWNGGKSDVFWPADWKITKSSKTYFTTTATTNANNVHGLCWYACGY